MSTGDDMPMTRHADGVPATVQIDPGSETLGVVRGRHSRFSGTVTGAALRSPAALASRHRAALLARVNTILGILRGAAAVRIVR
jgi:hypothetical protein